MLEVDEMWVARVANEVNPDVFVYLNLSRDQLDRVGEISTIEQRLRQAINEHKAATIVANIDDPLITSAAWDSHNPVWVAAGQGWSGDSLTSPRTGGIIVYADDAVAPQTTDVPFASGNDTSVWWRAISLDADGSSDATDVHSFARPYPQWSWSAPSCDFQPGTPMDIHIRMEP